MSLFIVLMKLVFFLSFATCAFAAPVKPLNVLSSVLDKANLKRDIVLVHGANDLPTLNALVGVSRRDVLKNTILANDGVLRRDILEGAGSGYISVLGGLVNTAGSGTMDVNLSDLLNKVPGAPSGGVNIPGLGSGTPLINTAGESADANGILNGLLKRDSTKNKD